MNVFESKTNTCELCLNPKWYAKVLLYWPAYVRGAPAYKLLIRVCRTCFHGEYAQISSMVLEQPF